MGRHIFARRRPFHVFLGGSPQRPGRTVVPASLSTLSNVAPEYRLPDEAPESERRLALAKWLVADDNPLPARVLANRLWHYHFGTGIVATPSDFGFMGVPPTHPELLDWLAGQLHENGWRLKPLHKQIMHVASVSAVVGSIAARTSQKSMPTAATCGDFRRGDCRPKKFATPCLPVAGKLDRRTWAAPVFVCTTICRTTSPPMCRWMSSVRRLTAAAVYHQNARASRIDLMTDFD